MRACCPCARSPNWRAGGATPCPNRRSRRPHRSSTPCGLGARQRCVNTPSGSATSGREGGRGGGRGGGNPRGVRGGVGGGGGGGGGAAAPLFHDRAALNKALARLPTD